MNNKDMNKIKNILLVAVLCALSLSCAKKASTPLNESAKAYFDAWMEVHYPDLQPTALGCYVISETEGKGELLSSQENSPYLRVHYVLSDLSGNVSATSREDLSKQLGRYSETSNYFPAIWRREDDALSAGLDESLESMRVGGRKKTIIPGWLSSTQRFDTPEEYLANVSGTNYIYDVEVVEIIKDIEKWEIDSLGRYIESAYPGMSVEDSLKFGFYYRQTKAPDSEEEFPNDTTIYINYIGRLLNGKVFDTTIADTAKRYSLYSTSATYQPVAIKFNKDDYTQIKMGTDESDVIDGFAYTLSKMKSHESGVGIFYSGIGYGSTGSGNSIPSYSPLIFEIEIVDKE